MNVLSFLSGKYEYSIRTNYNSQYVLNRLSENVSGRMLVILPSKPFQGFVSGNKFYFSPSIVPKSIYPVFEGMAEDDLLLIKTKPSAQIVLTILFTLALLIPGAFSLGDTGLLSFAGKASGIILISLGISLYFVSMLVFYNIVIRSMQTLLRVIGGGELI